MPIRRRRPLLRAAAVGGGAYYMGKRHAEGERQEAPPSPAATASPSAAETAEGSAPGRTPGEARGGMSAEAIERLQELADLHKQGVLTDEEFAAQKSRILG